MDHSLPFSILSCRPGEKSAPVPRFYMVYVEGSGSPTVKHGTAREATEEAARLAVKTGRRAYILNAISFAEASAVVTVASTVLPPLPPAAKLQPLA